MLRPVINPFYPLLYPLSYPLLQPINPLYLTIFPSHLLMFLVILKWYFHGFPLNHPTLKHHIGLTTNPGVKPRAVAIGTVALIVFPERCHGVSVSSWRGTPSHHPAIDGIFPYKLSIWGYPHDCGKPQIYIEWNGTSVMLPRHVRRNSI